MNVRIIEIDSFREAVRRVRDIGSDPYSTPIMAPKAYIRPMIFEGIDNRAANIIKQHMLSLGGEAVLNREISSFKKGISTIMVLGTRRQYDRLIAVLAVQPFTLKEWAKKIKSALSNYEKDRFSLTLGNTALSLGARPLVMGILNVTPDSFSDGGKYFSLDEALSCAKKMADEGASVIDIGGESTRPGARPVSVKEEIARVVPVIKKLKETLSVALSIDTYKPEVARAALKAGACIVNDITGMRCQNGAMARVVKKSGAAVIIMHMQGTPQTMQKKPHYENVVGEVRTFFEERIAFAKANGIGEDRIILDPGIGFGKTLEHNLELLRRLSEFRVLGMPVAVGTSRKAFIGRVLGDVSSSERLEGSLVSGIWAALHGAHFLRVHDVSQTIKALSMLNAIRSIEG